MRQLLPGVIGHMGVRSARESNSCENFEFQRSSGITYLIFNYDIFLFVRVMKSIKMGSFKNSDYLTSRISELHFTCVRTCRGGVSSALGVAALSANYKD